MAVRGARWTTALPRLLLCLQRRTVPDRHFFMRGAAQLIVVKLYKYGMAVPGRSHPAHPLMSLLWLLDLTAVAATWFLLAVITMLQDLKT